MAWEHLSITSPHLVYIILGGFTSLFMLCSSFIKERMYIGEATVATLCGLIFGPHAANLINPDSWGSVDIVTLEFSRVVLAVQCFAVGVELPKFYMEKHWRSVVFLLVPVMTFGWLMTSLFVWWMVPPLNWLESLVVAACVTATDPVLASSVVGKGKFAKRVPKHLRDLLSAESGCNDGMAFPFVYLSLYLIQDNQSAKQVSYHWIVYTILYECIFGAIYGFLVGYLARHGIKYAEKHELIDRESFLVFYFVLALFCAGSGSILGVDDLLVGFSCGVGFSNDGWFTQKTEESHVSNVIDLLLNLAYFVYLGTVIPWEQFNNAEIGLSAWRLIIIAIFVILFRRIPIMMAMYRIIPDIKSWREALFAGHFGPIGVGAVFVAILARGELEHDNPVPLASLPPKGAVNYTLLTLVWPIVTFLVISSIIVHGSSIAVFTLGKHINTLTITMSYTTATDDGASWMNRLPRISSQSRSQARTNMSDTDVEELKLPDMPPGSLPPIGIPGQFLRRVKEEEGGSGGPQSRSSSLSRRHRRRKWDDGIGPGGPISQSAIFPQRRTQSEMPPLISSPGAASSSPRPATPERRASTMVRSPSDEGGDNQRGRGGKETTTAPRTEESENSSTPRGNRNNGRSQEQSQTRGERVEVYDEHDHVIIENEEGDVLAVESPLDDDQARNKHHAAALKRQLQAEAGPSEWSLGALKKRMGRWRDEEIQKRQEKQKEERKHEPARAYQFGNTIIVEDVDGEVVKKYELPGTRSEEARGGHGLMKMGMDGFMKGKDKISGKPSSSTSAPEGGETNESGTGGDNKASSSSSRPGEPSLMQRSRRKNTVAEQEEEDDRHIRFTIGGVGQRLTKDTFIREMQKLDTRTRREVVDMSDASKMVKKLAKQEPSTSTTAAAKQTTPPAREGGNSESRGARAEDKPQSTSLTPSSERTSPGSRSPEQGMSSGSNDETDDNKLSAGEDAGDGAKQLSRTGPDSQGSNGGGSSTATTTMRDRGDRAGGDEQRETPAERRRREAALGIGAPPAAGEADDDSEDDETVRVPPATRRGIRFADAPSKSKVS